VEQAPSQRRLLPCALLLMRTARHCLHRACLNTLPARLRADGHQPLYRAKRRAPPSLMAHAAPLFLRWCGTASTALCWHRSLFCSCVTSR